MYKNRKRSLVLISCLTLFFSSAGTIFASTHIDPELQTLRQRVQLHAAEQQKKRDEIQAEKNAVLAIFLNEQSLNGVEDDPARMQLETTIESQQRRAEEILRSFAAQKEKAREYAENPELQNNQQQLPGRAAHYIVLAGI